MTNPGYRRIEGIGVFFSRTTILRDSRGLFKVFLTYLIDGSMEGQVFFLFLDFSLASCLIYNLVFSNLSNNDQVKLWPVSTIRKSDMGKGLNTKKLLFVFYFHLLNDYFFPHRGTEGTVRGYHQEMD
jgi:hypothetical protein